MYVGLYKKYYSACAKTLQTNEWIAQTGSKMGYFSFVSRNILIRPQLGENLYRLIVSIIQLAFSALWLALPSVMLTHLAASHQIALPSDPRCSDMGLVSFLAFPLLLPLLLTPSAGNTSCDSLLSRSTVMRMTKIKNLGFYSKFVSYYLATAKSSSVRLDRVWNCTVPIGTGAEHNPCKNWIDLLTKCSLLKCPLFIIHVYT